MNFIVFGKSKAMLNMLIDNIWSLNEAEEVVVKIFNNLNLQTDIGYDFIYKTTKYVIVEIKELDYSEIGFNLLGVNTPQSKIKIVQSLRERGGIVEKIYFSKSVHATASISPMVTIGQGFFASSQVSVAGAAKIGSFVGINRNASVGHHTEIGDYVSINPGAIVCGDCKIGEGTVIGAGATIKNGVSVGSHCIIGAGSVVVKDVPDFSLGWGNPFTIKETK